MKLVLLARVSVMLLSCLVEGSRAARHRERSALVGAAFSGLVGARGHHQLGAGLAATAMKIRVPHGRIPRRNHITKDRMP
jgi:hypothetical protein